MKPIDILRQELPKRGGWPEGMVCAAQSRVDGEIYFYDRPYDSRLGVTIKSGYKLIESSETSQAGCNLHWVTREEYEAVGWVPTVGTECEYLDANVKKWIKVQIKYISSQLVVISSPTVVSNVKENTEISKDIQLDAPLFRPIRTEAERAIDEMVRLSGVSTGAAKILYDAGYRK